MSADAIIKVVEPPPRPVRVGRFHVEQFDSVTPSAVLWRVKGLWPAVGVGFLGGPPMAGKSFWALDALARIRRGEPVLGRKSRQCGVVYVAAENAEGSRIRMAGLRLQTGPTGGGFGLISQAPDLTCPDDVAELKATLREEAARQAALGLELGLVAIDTMSASTPGADENSGADMSAVLRSLQDLAAELRLFVLVVAHPGKDESRGLRGWSGLLANADSVLMLEGGKGEVRTGTIVKAKDAPCGDAFAFALRVVEVGVDADGDTINTCVVDPEDAPAKASHPRRKPLTPKQALVLRAVNLCLDDGQGETVPPPPGLPPNSLGVHRDKVKARAKAEGYADDDLKPESVRRKLNSHLTDLIGLGWLRAGGEYLWPTP